MDEAFAGGGIWAADVVFCDSFDHLPPGATGGLKYGRVVGAYTLVPGPGHGQAAAFAGGGNFLDQAPEVVATGPGAAPAVRSLPFAAAQASVHLSLPDPGTWGAPAVVVLAVVEHDRGTPGAYTTRQWLEVGADGALTVRRAGAVVAASAPGAVAFRTAGAARWVHLEYRTRLDAGAAGTVEVRLDGAPAVFAGAVRTVTTTPRGNEFRLGNIVAADGEGGAAVGAANAAAVWADDFYFAYYYATSALGGAPPPAQGPLWVACQRPAGPGFKHTVVRAFPAGTPAAGHWALLAEAAPDGDATHLESLTFSATQGADFFALGAWPAVAGVPRAQRALVRWYVARFPPGGATAPTPYLTASAAYSDAPGGAWVEMYSGQAVDETYRLQNATNDAGDEVLATLQLGVGRTLGGSPWRCTHAAAELVYAGAGPTPPAGGQRWSVGGLP